MKKREHIDGAAFPDTISAIVGQTIFMRLKTSSEEHDRCFYRKPGFSEDVQLGEDSGSGDERLAKNTYLLNVQD